MITLLSFTSTQVLLALAGVGVAVTAVIAVMRFAMNRNSNNLLNSKETSENNKTSLRYRTKYSQVDAFNYSSTFTFPDT